jgi:hypothetical protein
VEGKVRNKRGRGGRGTKHGRGREGRKWRGEERGRKGEEDNAPPDTPGFGRHCPQRRIVKHTQ